MIFFLGEREGQSEGIHESDKNVNFKQRRWNGCTCLVELPVHELHRVVVPRSAIYPARVQLAAQKPGIIPVPAPAPVPAIREF